MADMNIAETVGDPCKLEPLDALSRELESQATKSEMVLLSLLKNTDMLELIGQKWRDKLTSAAGRYRDAIRETIEVTNELASGFSPCKDIAAKLSKALQYLDIADSGDSDDLEDAKEVYEAHLESVDDFEKNREQIETAIQQMREVSRKWNQLAKDFKAIRKRTERYLKKFQDMKADKQRQAAEIERQRSRAEALMESCRQAKTMGLWAVAVGALAKTAVLGAAMALPFSVPVIAGAAVVAGAAAIGCYYKRRAAKQRELEENEADRVKLQEQEDKAAEEVRSFKQFEEAAQEFAKNLQTTADIAKDMSNRTIGLYVSATETKVATDAVAANSTIGRKTASTDRKVKMFCDLRKNTKEDREKLKEHVSKLEKNYDEFVKNVKRVRDMTLEKLNSDSIDAAVGKVEDVQDSNYHKEMDIPDDDDVETQVGDDDLPTADTDSE